MAEVFDVFEAQGAHIGEIPISPQQRSDLHKGATITISYHTPRMLHAELGPRGGSFEVIERDGRLFVSDPDQAKRYIELQADIARLMKQPNKWIDPDAKSDPPVR